MDDLINHRFGFSLYKHLYSAVPPSITSAGFKSFQEVVQTVSGQHIQLLGINEQVIMDFLGSLLSIWNSLWDVPQKYWDHSPIRADPLTYLTKFIHIKKCEFQDHACYLLHPINLHPSQDIFWMFAVDAMTTLECIRVHILLMLSITSLIMVSCSQSSVIYGLPLRIWNTILNLYIGFLSDAPRTTPSTLLTMLPTLPHKS